MTAQDYLRAGRLQDCLQALQGEVRSNSADPKLRVFLFQLFAVLGQWERALNQLSVLASLSPETMMMARIFQPIVQCEMFRQKVFKGTQTPVIFGEPEEWMGSIVQANEHTAKGNAEAGAKLREQAFDSAPATSGVIDGKPFEWIADADMRFGPMLELILEGQYYWVPFSRIKTIRIEPPSDLRDLVWVPAGFVWANGGEASGHIPVRYPQTESATDDALRLSRKTDWQDVDGVAKGVGQRVFATDQEEHPILQCRSIDLNAVPIAVAP
jgi:type VI secretion system protein ImpE